MADLIRTTAAVLPEWVDYNDHMRDAHYAEPASIAVDDLMNELGIDDTYRTVTRNTIYTIEMHIRFLQEAKGGDPLLVLTRLLDADHKRLHIWQETVHAQTGTRLAVIEQMLIHIHQGSTPKSVEFPPEIQARVDAMRADHAVLPAAEPRSGPIGIRRQP